MDKLFDLIEDNKEELKDQLYKDLIETYGRALKESSQAKVWRFKAIGSEWIIKGPIYYTDYDLGCQAAAIYYESVLFQVTHHVVPKESEQYTSAVSNSVLARKILEDVPAKLEYRDPITHPHVWCAWTSKRIMSVEEELALKHARIDRLSRRTMKDLRMILDDAGVFVPTEIQGKRITKSQLVEMAAQLPMDI
jgi:hypothetical protein